MPDFNPDPNAFPLKRFAFPWRAVHLPVVPAVFDNSLSLLEVCQKMLNWLNQIIEQTNALQADLVELKEYVDSQDAATLAAANAYAVALRDALKEYVDTQDAATLASAKAYADGLVSTLRTYVDAQDAATLAAAKTYAESLRDALKDYVDTQDAANLATAKAYADGLVSTLRTYVDAQDAATLAAAKDFADSIGTALRTYVDTQLALKQDELTFDNTPTTGSNNPVTSNGIAIANDNLFTYFTNREQTIRDDFNAKFYDVVISSYVTPVLPNGITYSSINAAAADGKIVRVRFPDTGIVGYYVGVCQFTSVDVANNETIGITIYPDNTVDIESW